MLFNRYSRRFVEEILNCFIHVLGFEQEPAHLFISIIALKRCEIKEGVTNVIDIVDFPLNK